VFRELLKSTPINHPDFSGLEQCLKKTLAIADYVNEKKRNSENLQKMLEIRDHMTDLKVTNASLRIIVYSIYRDYNLFILLVNSLEMVFSLK
jgi:hypothetical protein